jgi:hypothetical protein
MSLDVSVPCTVLPVLDSHNYHSWAIELQTFFEARKLWDIVSGHRTAEIRQAVTADDGSTQTEITTDPEFRYSDASIRSILLSSVDPTQRSHIIRITTAKGMWDTLRQIHDAPSRNRTMALVSQLVNYEPRSSSINKMASALEDLKTRIAAISPKSVLPDEYMILKLMKIAGPAYDTVREILMGQAELTWTDEVARLREKEIALSASDPQPELGLAAKRIRKRPFRGPCYNCGLTGHNARHCQRRKANPNEEQHRYERQPPADQHHDRSPNGHSDRFSQKRLGHTERRDQQKRRQKHRAPHAHAPHQAAAVSHEADYDSE